MLGAPYYAEAFSPLPAAAFAWSPDIAEALGRRTAPSRSSGAGPGGHRRAAATGSRPAMATRQPRTRAGPHRRRVPADAAWPAATWVTRKEGAIPWPTSPGCE